MSFLIFLQINPIWDWKGRKRKELVKNMKNWPWFGLFFCFFSFGNDLPSNLIRWNKKKRNDATGRVLRAAAARPGTPLPDAKVHLQARAQEAGRKARPERLSGRTRCCLVVYFVSLSPWKWFRSLMSSVVMTFQVRWSLEVLNSLRLSGRTRCCLVVYFVLVFVLWRIPLEVSNSYFFIVFTWLLFERRWLLWEAFSLVAMIDWWIYWRYASDIEGIEGIREPIFFGGNLLTWFELFSVYIF